MHMTLLTLLTLLLPLTTATSPTKYIPRYTLTCPRAPRPYTGFCHRSLECSSLGAMMPHQGMTLDQANPHCYQQWCECKAKPIPQPPTVPPPKPSHNTLYCTRQGGESGYGLWSFCSQAVACDGKGGLGWKEAWPKPYGMPFPCMSRCVCN